MKKKENFFLRFFLSEIRAAITSFISDITGNANLVYISVIMFLKKATWTSMD